MAIESYILTQNFKSPCVQVTGVPHSPQAIRFKTFLKGQIVKGEMKHANNQPAFILVGGKLIIPANIVKKITTQDITSNASGATEDGEKKPLKLPNINKFKYIDAVIMGAALGVGFVFLAEKQKWIETEEKKNKVYGGLLGAGIGLYALYRYKAHLAEKPKETE